MNELVVTKDFSPTIFSQKFNQTYHSLHGAMNESLHVFIDHGLKVVSQTLKELSIFEMGFGTGLNAALSWEYAKANHLMIDYKTIELFPVDLELMKKFDSKSEELNSSIQILQNTPWDSVQLFDNFKFEKNQIDLKEFKTNTKFDLIYFDAFSPNTQPELWTEEVMSQMYSLLNRNGRLVTYCAKGEVKRNMKKVGFILESPPGPAGKREITVAKKLTTNN